MTVAERTTVSYRGQSYRRAKIGGGAVAHWVDTSWLELADRYRVTAACGRRGHVTSTEVVGVAPCRACSYVGGDRS